MNLAACRILVPRQSFMDGFTTAEPDIPALLDAWCALLFAANCSPQTVRNWLGIVGRAASYGCVGPTALTSEGVAYYLATFNNGHTRRTYWIGLMSWCRFLVDSEVRADNPMTRLRRPKLPRGCPRPISTISLYRMLGQDRLKERTRGMILLAAYAGLRVHEVAKVRGEDFDIDQMLIEVRGKGGHTDLLPLHPQVLAVVERMPTRGLWYPSRANPGHAIDARTVTSTIKGAMVAADVSGVPHGLRAWYATSLLRAGVDVRTVQTLMRHASLNTTQLYLEVVDEARRAAVLTLPVAVTHEPIGQRLSVTVIDQ